MGRLTFPFRHGRRPIKPIEREVCISEHLGQHQNLSGVHAEVFDHVKNCFENRNVRSLDSPPLKQLIRIVVRQRRVDIMQGLAQQRLKFGARDHLSLGKLGITIARVRGAADAANNPLARVSAEVQKQIADAV